MTSRKNRISYAGLLIIFAFAFVNTTRAQSPAAKSTTPANEAATSSQNRGLEQNSNSPEPARAVPSPTQSNQPTDDHLPFMTEERQRSTAEAPSVFGLVIRTFGALALIVGLIVAIAYGIRKFGGPRFGATRDDSPELSVLSSVSLGDKRSLAVVKFGERTLLVGSTAQAITLLVSEPTGSLASSPTPRSVAEILRDEEPSGFDDEIALATRRLEDEPANWDNAGGIA